MDRSIVLEQVPDASSDVLISILPMHARRIYAGQKLYELRKVLPQRIPRRIFLYETDRNGVTGHIVVNCVVSGSPEAVWENTRELGTERDRFFDYFANRPLAYAFKIEAAVRYSKPVPIGLGASEKNEKIPVPQSFLYLDNFPDFRDELRWHAFDEVLKQSRPLSLRMLTMENHPQFLSLIEKHITGSYLETGRTYGRKLIEVHSRTGDREGVLSLRKIILEVRSANRLIGFCVLTEKIGGSVKTGPVMFLPRFRNKGVGTKLRGQLHRFLGAYGYRKVYCTTPVNNDAAVSYLLHSNYRVEAHLKRHYHQLHDEFVFGFSLTNRREAAKDYSRPIVPATRISMLKKESPSAALFLQTEFSEQYCSMPDGWAARQIREAIILRHGRVKGFKPRRIYVAESETETCAIGLCVRKRGGSVKILIASRTGHIESLTKLIRIIESDIQSEKAYQVRKMYTFVSVANTALQNAFYAADYFEEGLLDRPYRASDDLIVFGKIIMPRSAKSAI